MVGRAILIPTVCRTWSPSPAGGGHGHTTYGARLQTVGGSPELQLQTVQVASASRQALMFERLRYLLWLLCVVSVLQLWRQFGVLLLLWLQLQQRLWLWLCLCLRLRLCLRLCLRLRLRLWPAITTRDNRM